MRNKISLSGFWQFQLDPDGILTVDSLQPGREIPVPMPWQAAFPELREYSGYAWYLRTIQLDEDWLSGQLLLGFGAVDYWCQVYVNGELAGGHEGGYTPFTMPVHAYARPGANEIAVRVYDPVQSHILIPRWPRYPAETGAEGPPFDANDIPHGKQEWYINVGGIWQDVTLTAVPAAYIESVRVIPDIHTGQAHITVDLGGEGEVSTQGRLHVTISDGGSSVTEQHVDLDASQASCEVTPVVAQPHLWSTEDPHLYTLTASLSTAGGDDEVSTRFGFREISARDGKLYLNGEPLFLLSALDQDFYPDTIYTVPSEEYLRDQFRKAKELGLNNLRCHIKPPDPLYLDLADEMGLLVWAEIPSWRTFALKGTVHPNQIALDDAIKARVEQTLEEMVRRDFNHPSVIIWTIVNEDWGTSLPLSGADRAWVSRMYDFCKQLDPTRLVVDNSACLHSWGPNVHVKSDLDDFHVYANIPDQTERWEQMIDQFNLRPTWTYSGFGDAQRTGREPLVLSEFGNWGLPSLRLLREPAGTDPEWFSIGPWWSSWEGEPGWPAGADERFAQLGLDTIWGSYEEFATATQWHQYEAMKLEIETMRRQHNLAGYVITELADIYWESNGLLDFMRHPKAYHNVFARINAPDMVVPQTDYYAAWDDRPLPVCLHATRYSAKDWSGARLAWSVEGTDHAGEVEAAGVGRGEARNLGVQRIPLPGVQSTRKVPVRLELRDAAGARLAQNSLDVLVLPAAERQPSLREPVAVITSGGLLSAQDAILAPISAESIDAVEPHGEPLPEAAHEQEGISYNLQASMRRMGYQVTRKPTSDVRIALTDHPNTELLEWVREGGDLLFICRGASPFYWAQSRGGAYSGNWITSFSWLRTEIHRRLKVDNPLGLAFRNIMPTSTILGLPVEDPAYQRDFLAGMVSGWVRHPAVHTVQFRYGQGRVIMTTFALEQGLRRNDPVAAAMLHDLMEYLHSEECRPSLVAG